MAHSSETEEKYSKQLQQEKQAHLCKTEVEMGPSKDLQKDAQEKNHTFKFDLNSETYSVSCKSSMTVLEALQSSKIFKTEKGKTKNIQKEIIIQRSKGEFPRAAVKTDFPCCLIARDETLDVIFVRKDKKNSENGQTPADNPLPSKSSPETLVTFWVKKDGGTNVKCLLKSDVLRTTVNYVCVWAIKGEKIRTALKRDGRFRKVIFTKHCGLSEFSSDTKHELSMPVDNLDRKAFQVVVISDKNQPDSQEDCTPVNSESYVSFESDVAEKAGPSQNPINTEPEKNKQTVSTKSTAFSTKRYATKPIKNSEDLLGFLRRQYKDLVKTLKQRENLKNNSDVQKFFRAEFSKSVENFSEVKKLKELMRRSDSVCQIRLGKHCLGSGFLLFDRFILTNAHVVDNNCIMELTAVFDYEDSKSAIKQIPIKQLISYFNGKDDSGCYLDYAVLELDPVITYEEYPELIDFYSPSCPINRDQICIVGHPDGGVKKMDPCIVIERDKRKEAADKHVSENSRFIQTIKDVYFKETWDFLKYDNEITYDSCFFHGSSGSPVFNRDCHLIGIHTGGYKYGQEGKKTLSVMEYGFSMLPILAHSKAKSISIEYVKKLEEKLRGKNVSESPEHQNETDTKMETEELFKSNTF